MGDSLRARFVAARYFHAALIAIATVAGCGGDVSSSTRLMLAGTPAGALSPGREVQLSAIATTSDGAARDVTAMAAWTTTDARVATVSVGRVTATGPGGADIAATYDGASSSVPIVVVALRPAYFRRELEHAFEYALDANGRVASYRIARRPDVDYGAGLGDTQVVDECRGDLREAYSCASASGAMMRGESGRLVGLTWGLVRRETSYRYGAAGLLAVETRWDGPGSHQGGTATNSLTYDGLGRLARVDGEIRCVDLGGTSGSRSTAFVTLDPAGRLAHADEVAAPIGAPSRCGPAGIGGSTDWGYDARGYMISAGTTTYAVDADGWLAKLADRDFEIVRMGTRVVEESFTQAYPSPYYNAGPQRVRYEWGRLPAEPLFVPRALRGTSGADVFGVLSSHHR